MKNKLFIVLPILLVGLVGCGNKGGNKNSSKPIDFYEFHQLALKMDEKDNPLKYATIHGYAYDYEDTEHYNFALEDKYVLNEEGDIQIESSAYNTLQIYNLANLKASDVEDDDACVYYKYADGRLGYYMEWYDGIERYEFNKYGRIIHAETEYREPEIHDDRVLIIPPMEADMDLTVTWSKKHVDSKSYFLGFDGNGGMMENGKGAMILAFPKTTDEIFINVLRSVNPFLAGYEGSWLARCLGIHDEYQVINQSLVYDADYIANMRFGYFYFTEQTKQITVELTVEVGYQTCIQLQFGESVYQESIYVTENNYVLRATLNYGNYIEPRAKRDIHVLRVFGKVYSVSFANQSGLYNKQNAGLLAAEYSFSETWVAQVPSYAFKGCSNLEGIEWPSDEASLIYVDSYAFFGCGQNKWQLFLDKNLSLNDYALSGCSAVVVWDIDKIPSNTSDPGYDAWHTRPGNWSETYDSGFEGKQAYYAWSDFVCQIGGGAADETKEYIFAIYWTEDIHLLNVASQDAAYNTTVTVYDDQFSELQELIVTDEETSRINSFSYQANEWIYISVQHTGTDVIEVQFGFVIL